MSIVSSLKPDVSAGVGVILLAVPSYFIGASVLRQNAPGLSFLGSPIILLGALFVAFTLNTLRLATLRTYVTSRKSRPNAHEAQGGRTPHTISERRVLSGWRLGHLPSYAGP